MKTVIIKGKGAVAAVESAKPVVKPDEVLLKIGYVGFCGSDLNTWFGRNQLAKMPVIPGHEIGATVEVVGAGVPEGLLSPGMNVTVNPYTSCGNCASCRRRRPNACRDNQTLGVQRDGAMSEYFAVPWEKVIPAGNLSLKECALVEPLSVGFHAVARGGITDSDTVMVIGCGMIGLGAIVRASLRGAKVIAVDVDPCKLELAEKMGASFGLNSAETDFHAKLMALTDGNGPDVVVEAVGADKTYVLAVEEVAFTGRVVCIGYAAGPVCLPTKLFVQKELDIRGSRNALPEDFNAVLKYMERGCCPLDSLVSDIVKPEDAGKALEWWSGNRGKVFRILVDFQ